MAKADPWAQFADAPDEEFQPDQQAMGADPGVVDEPPEVMANGEQDQFAGFSDAEPASLVDEAPGQIMFGDEMPEQVSTRLSPEDETELLRLLQTGTAADARRFAAAKGFAGPDNFDEVIAARDRLGKVDKNIDYHLPKPINTPTEAGSVELGIGRALPFFDELGGVVDALGGTNGRENVWNSDKSFGDLWGRNVDINRGILDAAEEEHPTAMIVGQLLGTMAIPVGLEGVALKAGTSALRSGATMQEARAVAAIAVRNRLAASGGAYGALHGAGEADGGLGNRMAGGAIEGALGAATGGLLGKMGEIVAPRIAQRAANARNAPLTDGQEVGAAAARQKIDVLPADVGGPMTRRLTGAAAQAPLSASPIINRAQRVIEQGKAVRDRVAGAFGTPENPEAAGERAADAARRWMRRDRGRIGRIYDIAAAKAGPDFRVPLPNAKGVVDAQIARLAEVPTSTAKGTEAYKALEEARVLRASLDGEFTVQGVRDMRTQMFVAPEYRGTPAEARLKQIVEAAADDILQGLTRAGKSDAARAFRTADDQWRERLKTIERVIEPIIGAAGKEKSGEEIVQGLERAMKGNGRRYQAFMGALDPKEADITRASLINRIGRASAGRQDADGEAFSLNDFLTHWNSLGERAKAVTFGREGRAALNDLARVAQGTKEAQRYANFSNTSGGIWGNLGLLAGGASYAPKSAALAAAAQLISGRVLASPRFARWLARAPTTKLSGPAYIDRLSRIARAEPAIANDVLQLQARLAEAFSSSPARLAADEGGQEGGGVDGNDQQR